MPFAGELATNVAASFVFEFLKRPIAAIAAEFQLRESVSRALGDRPPSKISRILREGEKSVSDLARVIGNNEGLLTTEVAEYLRELQRTSIPEAAAQLALCGQSPDRLSDTFKTFHNRFNNIPFTAEQMLNALHASITERLESVQDKALLEIIRAQHGELRARLDAVIQALSSYASHENRLKISQLKEARLKVAKLIESSNRNVTVETLQGSKKYSLRSLAIPGRLIELDSTHIQSAKIPRVDSTQPYLSFRRNIHRAVLLGDPGGGKSTMTQLISFELANIVSAEAQNPERRDFDRRDLRIPLKIVLRSFEAKQQRNTSYNFFESLKDDIKIAFEYDDAFTTLFLKTILAAGEAIVIFDGLDEVLDVGARRAMVNYIEQFSEIYAACPILVTSRLVGYRDAPLNDSFIPSGLARFNKEEIQKYSEKAIKAVSRANIQESRDKAREFINQTDRIGGDIRENPLMLGLMVQIFVYRGDVPSNRPEVYKECATLMFERWDGRREIVANVPRQEIELLDVFGYVASKTFGNANKEEGVSKEWLFKELRGHFEGWFVDKASANRAAHSLVDFLTGRAWVMSEVGHEVFKFTHRTFLEYFFARHLISESRSIDDLIERNLIPKLLNNEWVLISHLALHMAIFRDGGKTRQAAECVQRNLESLRLKPTQELPFLEFVASALDYVLIPEKLYVEIVKLIVERAIRLGARETFAASSVIWSLFSTANHRDALAFKTISESVDSALASPGRPEFLFSLYLLGARHNESYSGPIRRHIRAIRSPGWHKFASLREKKQSEFLTLAKKYPDVARAFIYVYNIKSLDLYQQHGQNLLDADPSPLRPAGADQIVSSRISALSYFLNSEREFDEFFTQEQFKDSASFISAIANDITSGRIIIKVHPHKGEFAFGLERDLDETFQSIWMSIRRSRRSIDKILLANMLVCAFYLSDQIMKAVAPHTSPGKRHDVLAPMHILRDMVSVASPNEHSVFLDAWISSRTSGRARRTVSPDAG